MRIWSLHPRYLDSQGLIALWREALLAKKVLEGRTHGYKNHPQLHRFKAAKRPVDCVCQYLSVVYEEAVKRGYNFDKAKIDWDFKPVKLMVTRGQIKYEENHLLKKLKLRDPSRYNELKTNKEFLTHPLFEIVEGNIEAWERINHDSFLGSV
jgi:hypothetical protein